MILSILAFLALFASICIKDRKHSLKVQASSCLFKFLNDLTLKAYTGAVLSLINFIRSLLFSQKEKISKKIYIFLLFLFETIILTNCVLTWDSIISILPTTSTMIRTYCLWQSNMTYVRMSGIIMGIFYGMYYIYYQSWLMVIGYGLLFIISIYNMCKLDIKSTIKSNSIEKVGV